MKILKDPISKQSFAVELDGKTYAIDTIIEKPHLFPVNTVWEVLVELGNPALTFQAFRNLYNAVTETLEAIQ